MRRLTLSHIVIAGLDPAIHLGMGIGSALFIAKETRP
jgi:hypothetical protein